MSTGGRNVAPRGRGQPSGAILRVLAHYFALSNAAARATSWRGPASAAPTSTTAPPGPSGSSWEKEGRKEEEETEPRRGRKEKRDCTLGSSGNILESLESSWDL